MENSAEQKTLAEDMKFLKKKYAAEGVAIIILKGNNRKDGIIVGTAMETSVMGQLAKVFFDLAFDLRDRYCRYLDSVDKKYKERGIYN